jgi:hypothetical protein
MSFDNFFDAQNTFLLGVFVLALIMGAVVNKTNFCTMGAVSDLVNMGDTGRIRAWLLAIAVAILGVVTLEYLGLADLDGAFPPYRGGNLLLAENVLGGLMFGIGMTLASGCGNKCLIRIGGGNLKSVVVFLIVGTFAYFMVSPFPGSDQTLMSLVFYDWIRPMSINLGVSQDLGQVIFGDKAAIGRLVIGLALAALILWFVFKAADFRASFDNVLGGLVVGAAVIGAWYVTSNIIIDADGESLSLGGYYEQWEMLEDSEEGKPAMGRTLSSQSFTFINPMAQSLEYAVGGFSRSLLTFGVVAVAGVVLGSLLWSLLSRRFRIEWFSSVSDLIYHAVGAVLMGIGGTMALGCTIGQAVTGVSTLAIGSLLTFGAIFLGSALTMKVQYYKMVYEDEATVFNSLLTGLVDLKLLPEKLRRLEAI